MTPEQRAAVEEMSRLNRERTPGPWRNDGHCVGVKGRFGAILECYRFGIDKEIEATTSFIAACGTNMDTLLSIIAEQEAEIERLASDNERRAKIIQRHNIMIGTSNDV